MPDIPPAIRGLLDWAYHDQSVRDSETVAITAGELKSLGAVLGYEPRNGYGIDWDAAPADAIGWCPMCRDFVQQDDCWSGVRMVPRPKPAKSAVNSAENPPGRDGDTERET